MSKNYIKLAKLLAETYYLWVKEFGPCIGTALAIVLFLMLIAFFVTLCFFAYKGSISVIALLIWR